MRTGLTSFLVFLEIEYSKQKGTQPSFPCLCFTTVADHGAVCKLVHCQQLHLACCYLLAILIHSCWYPGAVPAARAAADVIAGKKKNPFSRKAAADVTDGGQLNASAKGARRRKPDGWHYAPPPDKSRTRRGKGGFTKEQLFLQVRRRHLYQMRMCCMQIVSEEVVHHVYHQGV